MTDLEGRHLIVGVACFAYQAPENIASIFSYFLEIHNVKPLTISTRNSPQVTSAMKILANEGRYLGDHIIFLGDICRLFLGRLAHCDPEATLQAAHSLLRALETKDLDEFTNAVN